ncbi:hypothetical protein AYO21_06838 [Fonsecaea monophora]|uniref:RING-type E3 ubiquitin transferase n=1 Tax=Fonsecaea monophora TaxID=254056 RepID=A0A177F5T9_9EURO|nr:hypothetical protein AYO21_06838 [Fonsecaea monophora]OAG38960.1 hypothetical protein AYO21_06838 [Fonsecaea monophora]
MTPCRFFARGNCARGTDCRFDHTQPLPHRRASAGADTPTPPKPLCRFYARGACRNGSDCRYPHPANSDNSLSQVAAGTHTHDLSLANGISQIERFFKGARVRIGEGTQILDVKFPSDDTGVRGHPPTTKVQVSTVLCSWYNPSRIVWLHYRSSRWATNASKRFERKLQGRQVTSKIQPPSKRNGRPKSIWSVQLNNVSVETTKKDLQEHLRGVEPDDIVFGKPTSQKTQQEAVDWVEGHLMQTGRKLRSFNVEATASGSRMKAFACFESPSDARDVVALAQTNVPDLGSRLFVETVAAVAVPVLRDLHSVLKDKLEELQSNNKGQVSISAHVHREVKLVMLRIYGPKPQDVARVKSKLGEMLTGTVVLDDRGSALWHDFFAKDEALSCFKSISQDGKIFIYRDLRKQQLQLYGLESLFEEARRTIILLLNCHSSIHLITLEGNLFKAALSGGFRRLVRKFGRNNAIMDIQRKPPAIIFQGSPRETELVRSLLFDRTFKDAEVHQADDNEECPCCFSTVEDPVKIHCGHTYCRGCFEGLCEEVKHHKVPIVCFGNSSHCGQVVSLKELKEILRHDKFEAVLEASIGAHIRSQPDKMQYCPTPDCPTIYKVSDEASVFTCVNCLTSICAKCRKLSHDGLTCQQARDESTASRETERFKKQNNIKDCPACGTAMYKEGGCNHMVCQGCGTHLCWLCLERFTVELECYRHLHDVHGTIGNLDPAELQRAELERADLDPGLVQQILGQWL